MVNMNMIELGEVLHLARSGRLIVKLHPNSGFSKIGQFLFDDEGKKIGRIIELIGSVRSPFASVSPDPKSSNKMNGMKVFESGPGISRDSVQKSKSNFSKMRLYKGKRK
jgi:rRNA processing protein Gar1